MVDVCHRRTHEVHNLGLCGCRRSYHSNTSWLEKLGIDPSTSRMLSERSTI
jgi:hypothetical protein